MNNTELVTELDKLVATSRFSHTRKTCLSEFIGKKYKVSGLVSRVGNTSGYSRRPELRKGKTITLGLSGSNTKLLIRCNRSRSLAILEHDLSQQFSITITITGYDDVRQYLQADELGEMNAPRAAESNTSLTMIGDNVQHAEKALGANSLEASSSTNDQADQLLAELEQMQLDSQNILSEVADDINRAQSRNLPLLRSDYKDQTVTTPVVPGIGEAAAPSLDTETEGESAHPGVIQIRNEPEGISQSKKDLPQHPESDEIIQNSTVIDTTTGLRQRESKPIQNASTKPNAEMEDLSESEKKPAGEHWRQAQGNDLDQIRREILSNQQKPIEQNVFAEVIALQTGVSVVKVREIQKQLWHAILSPSMFGTQRDVFNFFPFGDFRLLRNRNLVNMDFKSAPVKALAEHAAVEKYPHSNFDGSDAESSHPPIATHAIRIAATVAPIVGLSPPVTYDVIFETLQLLLKVFGVGKRRIRFQDVGEFFPVVLRGTLQYHFRPYRPLVRFATESFRAIISLAEQEGEGQLAFEADNGVPDRSRPRRAKGNRGSSRSRSKNNNEKKPSVVWVVLILAFIVYQAVVFFIN
ncbi:MAG: hypothetical protein HOB73_09655 [Planctomycetaceae bacterium]|jgi:hypothetical protein|nr:hypothetical protein [Planctomycetaceae bacterium]